MRKKGRSWLKGLPCIFCLSQEAEGEVDTSSREEECGGGGVDGAMPPQSWSIEASAPGKVILHGEHSVVYRKTGVVVSIDLRTKESLLNLARLFLVLLRVPKRVLGKRRNNY